MSKRKTGTGTEADQARITEIEAMSLKRFRAAGLLLHVESKVVEEVIGFASNQRSAARAPKGMVVYLADELAIIHRDVYDAVAFRAAHLLKKKTDGTIVDPVKKAKRTAVTDTEVEVGVGNLAAAERLQGMVGG